MPNKIFKSNILNSTIGIVIVNLNGGDKLKKCLQSLNRNSDLNYEICLVDNGSTDGSPEEARGLMKNLHLVKLPKNFGFCRGINIGFDFFLKDPNKKYIITLDNDTIVAQNWLAKIVANAKKFSHSYDIFNSRIVEKGKVYYTITVSRTGVFKRLKESKHSQNQREIFGASNCGTLYTREVLEKGKIKGQYLDESFFCYSEDVDFSWRARLLGFRCYYDPRVFLRHHCTSTGIQVFSTKKNIAMQNSINMAKSILKNGSFFLFYNILRNIKRYFGYGGRFFKKTTVSSGRQLSFFQNFILEIPSLIIQRIIITSRQKVSRKSVECHFRKDWPKKPPFIKSKKLIKKFLKKTLSRAISDRFRDRLIEVLNSSYRTPQLTPGIRGAGKKVRDQIIDQNLKSNGYGEIPQKIKIFENHYDRKAGTWISQDKPKFEYDSVEREVGRFWYSFVQLVRPRFILETGVSKGYSTACMAASLNNIGNQGKIYAIDPKKTKHLWDGTNLEDYITWIPAYSHQAVPRLKNIQFDLLVLDSDHSYQTVMMEIINFEKLLKKGGYILFHDALLFDGVGAAIKQLYQNPRFEVVTCESPRLYGQNKIRCAGISIVRKIADGHPKLKFEKKYQKYNLGDFETPPLLPKWQQEKF